MCKASDIGAENLLQFIRLIYVEKEILVIKTFGNKMHNFYDLIYFSQLLLEKNMDSSLNLKQGENQGKWYNTIQIFELQEFSK